MSTGGGYTLAYIYYIVTDVDNIELGYKYDDIASIEFGKVIYDVYEYDPKNEYTIDTILEKAVNPATKAFNRESYFTKITFGINNKTVKITTKIDTGASYTVIGLENKGLIRFKDKILKSSMRGTAYDASGTE